MDNFAQLNGKVALVTGAAAGIGAACARELASAGARVMLADIDAIRCKQQSRLLNDEGLDTYCACQDVTVEADWIRVIDQTLESCGGLDVLVNNAGIYVGGTLISNSLEEVHKVQKTNVDSVFLGMKHAVMAMRPDGAAGRGGSIINLSSVAGIVGVPGHSAYGASKGAVRLYTKHAAVEFARLGYGVRVNSIHPGVIETAMGDQVFEDFVEVGLAPDLAAAEAAVLQMTPMGRLGTVDDVAKMVRFLASDASSYCTGAEFIVDGGLSAA